MKFKYPQADKREERLHFKANTRDDHYFWLRNIKNKNDSETIKNLLVNENSFCDSYLGSNKKLQDKIFIEMKSRECEEYETHPYKHGEFLYYEKYSKGKEYPIHCRKKIGSTVEEICLDENELAKDHEYFSLGTFDISSDHNILAYTVDINGSEVYTLKFKNLITGEVLSDEIHNVSHGVSWYKDNYSLLYVVMNENQRPYKVMQHTLAEESDKEIYTEESGEFFVDVNESLDHEYIFITSSGSISNTSRYVRANDITDSAHLLLERKDKVEYYATHKRGQFYILTNDTHENFRVIKKDIGTGEIKEYIAPHDDIYISDIECYESHNVISYRESGLPRLKILFDNGKEHVITFPEPSYYASSGDNAEYMTDKFHYNYSSLTRPFSSYTIDLKDLSSKLVYQKEVPGFDPENYLVERINALSHDNKNIPISILRQKDSKLNCENPCLLYGYGSYGMNIDPSFWSKILSLVDRGFVFAIGHIRGSSTLGRKWYEDGKFLKKKNTFRDFISCAEFLIQQNYTKKGHIAINGGSAGGMLVGATLNIAPEGLFKVAVAEVPFVDVLNTMVDDTLPLTQLEYDEWGNPNEQEYYEYIKSYSPYDNIQNKDYPSILATGGLNDPRVTYWEPMKWIYKLRDLSTDKNPKLLYMNMGAGHGGASGRYEYMKEDAMIQTFILKEFGIES